MKLRIVEHRGRSVVEGPPGETLLKSVDDLNEVFAAQYPDNSAGALLYVENLVPGFFDVSTRVAGALLQKLHLYRSRMAVVTGGAPLEESRRFHELMAAERRDGFFGLSPDRSAALDWLTRGTG